MPNLELKIEQLTATARREALPTFDSLADRKLWVLLLFLADYKAISVVENPNLVPILIYCLRTTHCYVAELIYEYIYWPFSIHSYACMISVYQALFRGLGTRLH